MCSGNKISLLPCRLEWGGLSLLTVRQTVELTGHMMLGLLATSVAKANGVEPALKLMGHCLLADTHTHAHATFWLIAHVLLHTNINWQTFPLS